VEAREEIQCPACSEMILASAKKCKHCGEWIERQDATVTETASQADLPSVFFVSADVPTSPLTRFPLVRRDGTELGRISKGGVISVPLPRGTHELRFGIPPADSAIVIAVPPGGGLEYHLHWYSGWFIAAKADTAPTPTQAGECDVVHESQLPETIKQHEAAAAVAMDSGNGLLVLLGVMGVGFMLWSFIQAADLTTASAPTSTPSRSTLAPATESDRQTCARQASGGMYSANEIRQLANQIPDISVAYSGCVMRRRQARAGN